MALQAAAMSETKTRKKRIFTIYHGYAASLVLHAALGLPYLSNDFAPSDDESSRLVFELEGAVADTQSVQKIQEDRKGEAAQQSADATRSASVGAADDVAKDEPTDEADRNQSATAGETSRAPARSKQGAAGSNNVVGDEDQQDARTIEKERDAENDRVKDYVKRLTKKINSRLIYPDEGRRAGLRGVVTVSFAISSVGQLRPDSLRIVAGSGHAQLDASALKTVRASAPFGPPPREMTVTIAVVFGPGR